MRPTHSFPRFAAGALLLLAAGALFPAAAQELTGEAVISLPPETTRIEFIRLSALRALPSYDALRGKYTSPRLAELQQSLAELGIQDSAIDQILLAWQPIGEERDSSGQPAPVSIYDLDKDGGFLQNRYSTLLGGLASGQFDWKAAGKAAREKGIPSVAMDESRAYCVPGKSPACVAALQDGLGAFGNHKFLREILDAREGRGSNLVAKPRMVKLLQNTPRDAAIWGVAVGPGVADWFQGWDLTGGKAHVDWKVLSKPVQSLRYNVVVGDKVVLNVKLQCATSLAASAITQAFRGMKLLQGWMWEKDNPGRPNPVVSLDINSSSDEVEITLVTAGDALRDASPFTAAQPAAQSTAP